MGIAFKEDVIMTHDYIFEILTETEKENIQTLTRTGGIHLKEVLEPILKNVSGLVGEEFLKKFILTYAKTGSPLAINLDHNISGNPLNQSRKVCEEMEMIVKATAGHVSAYKMNFQSLLTFLIAKRPDFVHEIKEIFRETCANKYGIEIEPAVWLDQKLDDIPNTNFESGDILYKLGFDAIHCMPVIGPDSAGGLQLAAEVNNGGVIHVINLTHQGYKFSKKEYFKGENGEETILKLRMNAMGNLTFPTEVKGETKDVTLRAIGTIEPANRPYELYQGYTEIYKKNLMIISIGIGPQGALPGSALYSGATCEGIGRFIYQADNNKLDKPENIAKKAKLSKICTLLALSSRFSGEKYPKDKILNLLKDYNPKISKETEDGLNKVYEAIKSKGLY